MGCPYPLNLRGSGWWCCSGGNSAELVVLPCVNQVENFQYLVNKKRKYIEQPKSELDNVNGSPSSTTSTSTLSSSLGGGGGGELAAVSGNPCIKWSPPENQETSSSNVGVFENHHLLSEQSLDINGVKCGEMEDWESVLSESGQEQSILRWIMDDVEEPSMGLNKMLNGDGGTADGELTVTGEFGVVDQAYRGFDSNNPIGQVGNFHQFQKFAHEKIELSANPQTPPPAAPAMFADHHLHKKLSDPQFAFFSQLTPSQIPSLDVKPQILINPSQSHQNSTPFLPLAHQTLIPSQPKRYNPGSTLSNFTTPNPLQFLQHKPSSIKKIFAIDEPDNHHHQGIIDQLFKAADMIQSGNNPILAQSILARLNHQLSPIGKPFERAAFYFKEALQLLLHSIINNMNPISSPFSFILKIGAYKAFSEISPFVQFTNFTCNQSILEALDGFNQIHIVDFDIGYGDQCASFMQELALKPNNNLVPSLKITAFTSPMNDHFELSLTRDNLVNFAKEINIDFEFEIVNLDVLFLPFRISDKEAIAVNLSPSSQIPFPLVLRFVKNLSPKIVVSVDRGCERTDLPFPNHLIYALQSFSNLIESLDAVNMNLDTLQKIELFMIQPSIEKIVTRRYSFPEKTQNWRGQFLSVGFLPISFSNFTENQAMYVIKRAFSGFHIEKRHSELVLCWQRREIVSVSAWRC
ncbi:hypothetical protein Lser_V15G14202 [Lactuca serriola]